MEDRHAVFEGTREPASMERAVPFLFGVFLLFVVPWPARLAGLVAARAIADRSTSRRFAHVVAVWIEGENVPVVEHRFFGKTPQEALARYREHVAVDPFLAGCAHGLYGNRSCVVRRKTVEARTGRVLSQS